MLHWRFKHTDDLDDLKRVIQGIEEAVGAVPVDHHHRLAGTNNLGKY